MPSDCEFFRGVQSRSRCLFGISKCCVKYEDLLQEGEKIAGTLSSEMEITKANLSQHLKVMKSKGIVLSRREGVSIYYSIANPKIVEACQLMREVLMEQLDGMSRLREEYTGSK